MEDKKPFFARFLEDQGQVRTGVRAGGGPFHTLKYPSDRDEGDVTLKYPSDDDEV